MALPLLAVIAKQALVEVFNTGTLLNTVARDWSDQIADKGASVTVTLPETPDMRDAGGTYSDSAVNPSTKIITLNKWRETEPKTVDSATWAKAGENVLAMYATPIAEAIVKDVEAAILTAALTLTNSVGTVTTGTTDPASVAAFLAYKQKFDALEAPYTDRFVIAGPDMEAGYFGTFPTYNVSGETGANELITGFMGNRLGMNFIAKAEADDNTSKLIGFGYHKNAIGLVSRPMAQDQLAVQTANRVTESYKGLGLTLEMWYDPQKSVSVIRAQILYGLALVTGKGFKIYKA